MESTMQSALEARLARKLSVQSHHNEGQRSYMMLEDVLIVGAGSKSLNRLLT